MRRHGPRGAGALTERGTDVYPLERLVAGSRQVDGTGLQARVQRAAAGLAALGVGTGDRVAILMRNDLAQIEATLAAQWLGAYPVQMNWHGQGDELDFVLADCGARVLVAHTDLLQRLSPAPRGVVTICVVPPAELAAAYAIAVEATRLPPDGLEWEAWLAAAPPHPPLAAAAVESIIYTSGTTGRPKGVRRFAPTVEQVALTERMREQVFGVGPGARALVPAPLYHTAPNLFAMRAVRKAQMLVLPARFDAAGLLADIERHAITHLYAVPTIFVRLLALPAELRARHDLSSLRFVLHAGGPCPRGVKQAMLDWWGPIIHEYYGATETGPATFCRAEEWLARPGTVGRPAEGVEIEVRDDTGRALGAGEVGEVCVRNAGYADFTYLHQPAARAELQRGSLIATGDLGFRDAEGYLYLCDRKRDLVISGGVNIYPAEVESVLQGLPGVADCAVFGIPDDEFGEALAALVQPEPGRTLEPAAVRAFLATRLARFKQPRVVEIRAQLPRDDAGKIRKRHLREPYWAAAGRTI